MNTSYRPKTMTDTYNHRSYFDWGSNMQVVRKTPEHSQMKNDADAKDKGKNTYTYHPSKKNPAKMQKEEEASFAGGRRLDIKI